MVRGRVISITKPQKIVASEVATTVGPRLGSDKGSVRANHSDKPVPTAPSKSDATKPPSGRTSGPIVVSRIAKNSKRGIATPFNATVTSPKRTTRKLSSTHKG